MRVYLLLKAAESISQGSYYMNVTQGSYGVVRSL